MRVLHGCHALAAMGSTSWGAVLWHLRLGFGSDLSSIAASLGLSSVTRFQTRSKQLLDAVSIGLRSILPLPLPLPPLANQGLL